MSRSYRKNVVFKGGGIGSSSEGKHRAAKKVRATKNVPNGSAYRKVYQTWNINDYKITFWDESKTSPGWADRLVGCNSKFNRIHKSGYKQYQRKKH